jgi:hypothetical protein
MLKDQVKDFSFKFSQKIIIHGLNDHYIYFEQPFKSREKP